MGDGRVASDAAHTPARRPQRIAVLGCSGSGKTTVARAVGSDHGRPVVHVDLVQREGGRVLPEQEWWARHGRMLEGDAWALEAMKLRLLDRRIRRADTAIFLDLPRTTCLLGIFLRRLRYRGGIVAADGVVDRIGVAFLRWVWGCCRSTRPAVLEVLRVHSTTTDVVVLRSRCAVRHYLASLPAVTGSARAEALASDVSRTPTACRSPVLTSD